MKFFDDELSYLFRHVQLPSNAIIYLLNSNQPSPTSPSVKKSVDNFVNPPSEAVDIHRRASLLLGNVR